MISSTKIDNRKKDILIIGKGYAQGLEHTLSAEKMYSINFTEHNNKFVWACITMEQIVIYLLMVHKLIKFKANDSKIVAAPLRPGNTSKDFSVDNMKKTGLNRYIYDFSIDYDPIAVDDILDFYKYLMKKNGIV